MAQTVIGLDIGTWSIKAAILESTLRGFTLQGYVEHHVPRDPEGNPADEDLAGSVAATLRQVSDWDSLCTALPGRRALLREVTLPFDDDKRIRSVLPFQLEDQLPVSMDGLVHDYIRIASDGEGTTLLCAAVERAWLTEFLASLKAAQADPRIVTLDTLAYAHLLHHMAGGERPEPVVLVDLGHTSTSVTVVAGGKPRTVRTLARGGHQVTLALMKDLGVDYGEAERIKHIVRLDGQVPKGVDEAAHARAAGVVMKALQPVMRDVRLTLHADANRWGSAAHDVVLFGGSARMPGVADALAQALGTPVRGPKVGGEAWSTLAADPARELSMPKAVALALRSVDEGRGEAINFRQGGLAFESDFKVLRDRAGFLLGMAALLVLAFFARQVVAYKGLERNHAALVAELQGFSAEVLGEERDDFDAVLKRLSTPPEADTEEIFPRMSAFKAFYEIAAAQEAVNERGRAGKAPGPEEPAPPGAPRAEEEAAPAAGADDGRFQVEMKQVQIDLKAAFLKGEANDIEAVEAFTGEIKKVPCFKDVETSDTTRISFGDRQDWLRFSLKVTIDCAVPAPAEAKKGEAAKEER